VRKEIRKKIVKYLLFNIFFRADLYIDDSDAIIALGKL